MCQECEFAPGGRKAFQIGGNENFELKGWRELNGWRALKGWSFSNQVRVKIGGNEQSQKRSCIVDNKIANCQA